MSALTRRFDMIAVSDDITLWTAKAMALACSLAAATYAAAQLEPAGGSRSSHSALSQS
jgi:hypothetical protein